MDMYKQVVLVLFMFFGLAPTHCALSSEYATVEIPLAKSTQLVDAEPLLEAPIIDLLVFDNSLVAVASRGVWVSHNGETFSKLDIFAGIELEDGWINSVCNAGQSLMFSIGDYPEHVKQKTDNAILGGFRAGPTSKGYVFYDGKKLSYQASLAISGYRKEVEEGYNEFRSQMLPSLDIGDLPKSINESIQSCEYDEGKLLLGSYGSLVKYDLATNTGTVLDLDYELEFNRSALTFDGVNTWVLEDEGGAAGGCLNRYGDSFKREEIVCLLGYNNNQMPLDNIFTWGGSVFTSSVAGLIEIDSDRQVFNHYRFSSNDKELALYDAFRFGGDIWGVREDGFVSIDLADKSFELYQIKGQGNDIYGLVHLNENIYVSNRTHVFRIDINDVIESD